ncbi:hypothetical protein SAMN05660649_01332 [Desulfotomaculum arcticum]|uniref:Radical SAM core domain-containing protein n=2 Tax=Desulfotruncus TaxID=2867377 RepID=A0A1I2QNW9_9FIRM|nr:hypothetical protein SAMN05660649_01332 [Desulfotomaculum arcticum] [Desulfotruncus arcticus DSM 17038]
MNDICKCGASIGGAPETTAGEVVMVTESICPRCLGRIPAWRVKRGNDVFLVKDCPEHGHFETVVWRGQPAYESWVRPKIPSQPPVCFTGIDKGCPFDCGLCEAHRQHTCTALLEITQRCNLQCSFCFAGAGGSQLPDPDFQVIKGWYEKILAAGGPFNIQLSGGEPTLRDDLPEIIALGVSLGFKFIQINTNGLRLARDPNFVVKLKEAGLASAFMQFDGVTDEVHAALRGRPLLEEKIKAIEQCAADDIGVVLVPTLVPGVNDQQIGEIIKFAVEHAPAVRGVHFQPVSYFGRYPGVPADKDRITIPEIINAIEMQTRGLVKAHNFEPPGCENAFCSFHGNFVLMQDGSLSPWTKHDPAQCSCKPQIAALGAAKTRDFVARHWAKPAEACSCSAAPAETTPGWEELDNFLARLRTHTFTISGMAFQDAWNLDLERLRDCCIHVISPEGMLIPFCAYNLTDQRGRSLYRPHAAVAAPLEDEKKTP